jgi:ABC-type phosphate transport system substrate-binding protein
MTWNKIAGPCVDGEIHLWGREEARGSAGVFVSWTAQQCKKCRRVCVRKYTARSSYIVGYENAIDPYTKALVKKREAMDRDREVTP